MNLFQHLLLGSALAAASAPAGEKPTAPNKSAYHLFHPTPREAMRELSTDRPDQTESPFTVDAGHVQVEMDLATFTYDRYNPDRADVRVESWSFGAVNFKVGLLNNVDFQVLVQPFNTVRFSDRAAGTTTRLDGFGDVTLRTKINLWGNDGGTTAFGLMPFVKLPSASDDLGNDAVEGGLIIPLGIDLGGGWRMGLMTEVDILEDADAHGHHAEWVNSITVSRGLTDRLGAYVEFFSVVSAEPHTPWVGAVDVGLTYAVSDDIQLDCGVNLGLTRAADDVNPFVGLSWRF
jgi:hypothetical protein